MSAVTGSVSRSVGGHRRRAGCLPSPSATSPYDEAPVSEPLSRGQALRILALGSTAGREDVKRAYRQLAREHHPDHGGDPDRFQQVTRAFERLVADDTPAREPQVARGRPSRSAYVAPAPAPDLQTIDWDTTIPEIGDTLSRDGLAVLLAAGRTHPLAPVAATSRSPGSRLNRFAPHLAGNSTAELTIVPDRDDRQRPVAAVQVRAWSRKGRKVLDQAQLLGRWSRIRGSSSTLLRATFPPALERRVTAAIAVALTQELLHELAWDLTTWTRTGRASAR